MSKVLRVGNLGSTVTASQLSEVCVPFGKVTTTAIASSPFSGKSRGFGFIEMGSEEEAAACLAGLNEKEIGGQKLTAALGPADHFKKRKSRKK